MFMFILKPEESRSSLFYKNSDNLLLGNMSFKIPEQDKTEDGNDHHLKLQLNKLNLSKVTCIKRHVSCHDSYHL